MTRVGQPSSSSGVTPMMCQLTMNLDGAVNRRYFVPLMLSLLLLGMATTVVDGKPATSSSHHRHQVKGQAVSQRHRRSNGINDNLLMYLMTFGYLPQSDLETGNLRTEDQVKDAIRNMQSFAGIPVTGQVDEATKRLMKTPRCGLPDITSDVYRSRRSLLEPSGNFSNADGKRKRRHAKKSRVKRYTVQGQKWLTTDLTYSIRPPGTKHMDVNTVRRQVRNALDLWSRASKLNFREVDADDADIKVSFHTGFHNDGYPFDGKGTLLAHAFFPGTGIGGDAHFDDDELWVPHVEEGGTGLSFYAVAAHEFGHSLGLSHSSVQGAIMFPYYQSITADYTLSDDDVRGIQYLYGKRDGGSSPDFLPTKPPPSTKKPIYPPKPVPTRPPGTTKPDTCDTSYDAISVIRQELFIFKDKYFWRVGKGGLNKEEGYPIEINRFWYGLPENTTHIDAVYEKQTPGREIVIFIGRNYWIFTNNSRGQGPFPLTQLGLPENLDKIDAAMIWGHNGKTYFFSGTMYWRFDEEVGSVELDYPRDMSMWKGVPYNIDSVFQWTDGKTYFFKGKVFWKFNDRRMRVESPTPSLSAPFWLGCPNSVENLGEDQQTSLASAALPASWWISLVLCTLLVSPKH